MNIKKPVDYSNMYSALDKILSLGMAQMDMFQEIGKLIDTRSEKGAAVAAADYISAMYPNVRGFSPRGIRRMREFYRAYKNNPALLSQAMKISWTANVVIIECCRTDHEREWYIQAVRKLGWSKQILMTMIAENAHEHMNFGTNGNKYHTKSVQAPVNEFASDNIPIQGTLLTEQQFGYQDVATTTSKFLPHFIQKCRRQDAPIVEAHLSFFQFYPSMTNREPHNFLTRHCGGLPKLACGDWWRCVMEQNDKLQAFGNREFVPYRTTKRRIVFSDHRRSGRVD